MKKLIYRLIALQVLLLQSLTLYAYKEIEVDSDPELFAYFDDKGNYGFKNNAGEIIVPPIYSTASGEDAYLDLLGGPDCPQGTFFANGLARVFDKNRGYGYIDYTGRELINCQYTDAFPFSNGLAAVANSDGLWGYINTKGEIVVPIEYKLATVHRENRAFIYKDNNNGEGKWAIIDNKGKILTDFIYGDIPGWPFFSEGIKIVSINNKYCAVDGNGKKIFDCENIRPYFYFSEGIIPYSTNDNNGTNLMDSTGKTVFKSKYTEIKPFINGITLVHDENGYGVIDRNFNVIVKTQYPQLFIEDNVLVAQNKEGKWGYLNLQGKEIIPFKFDFAYGFSNNLANVGYEGKFGFINKNGEFVIPPIYDGASGFDENGYAAIRQGEMFSIIDIEQKPLIPFKNTVEEVLAIQRELGKLNAKSDVDVNIPITDASSPETVALIIANEKYSSINVGNVQYAKNDGKTIKDYFIKTLGIPENNIMICENATLSQMISGVKWLKNKSNFQEIKNALVYYSGHGIPDYLTNKSYLLPSDGNSLDISTAFPLEDFYAELEKLEVNQCITFIDACFSGNNRRGEPLNEVRGISIKPKVLIPQNNVIVLSASRGDEVAQSYPQKHHGMFTYFLLKFLQENSTEPNLRNMAEYIENNVKSTTLNLTGKLQSPSLFVSPKLKESWRNIKIK